MQIVCRGWLQKRIANRHRSAVLLFERFGKVVEKIVVEHTGNAPKQFDIDIFLVENFVSMSTGAADLRCKPSYAVSVLFEFFLNLFADVHDALRRMQLVPISRFRN